MDFDFLKMHAQSPIPIEVDFVRACARLELPATKVACYLFAKSTFVDSYKLTSS
jgi:hypothetical protein